MNCFKNTFLIKVLVVLIKNAAWQISLDLIFVYMFIGLMIFNDFHLVRYLFCFNLFSQYFDFEVSSFLLARCWIFSSPKPTAQVSFSDHNLSVVVVVVNFSIFVFFSRTTGLISTILGTKHSSVTGDSSFFKWRALPFPRGDNNKIAKIHWRNF